MIRREISQNCAFIDGYWFQIFTSLIPFGFIKIKGAWYCTSKKVRCPSFFYFCTTFRKKHTFSALLFFVEWLHFYAAIFFLKAEFESPAPTLEFKFKIFGGFCLVYGRFYFDFLRSSLSLFFIYYSALFSWRALFFCVLCSPFFFFIIRPSILISLIPIPDRLRLMTITLIFRVRSPTAVSKCRFCVGYCYFCSSKPGTNTRIIV